MNANRQPPIFSSNLRTLGFGSWELASWELRFSRRVTMVSVAQSLEIDMRRLAAILIALAASSACLRSTTAITVRADGSGTVVQETAVSAQALAMLKGLAPASDKDAGGQPPSLFGEEQAKKAAAEMGVRFVSGEAIKTETHEGYRANFEFDDIGKLQMKMNQDPTTGTGRSEADANERPFGFKFDRREASSILTIVVPEQKPGGGPLVGGLPGTGSENAQANAQSLQMMKVMMAGLFVDISLGVDGRIVKTNATHVEGSRITLLQLDFDRLLADDAAMQKLQAASDLKALAAIPGLKIVAEPTLTVEFVK
ncbi:MAG TPA: hypothetical protein VLD67_11880 [Vicinamibacterales bacterium]|nr:hypothetical protein [Vicinamibacterales bacterium]